MLFNAGSAGGGVAGGAASGAGAGAIFGPWGMAIGAAAGAVMGGIQQNQQNKKIRKAAIANQENINKTEMQTRLGTMQALSSQGEAFRVSQANNQVSMFNDSYRSGNSLNAALASNLGQQIQGTKNVNMNMENQIAAMELQKKNIVTDARNQSTPVGMAAVQGGFQGAQVAGQFIQGVNSFRQLGINEARAGMQQDLMKDLQGYNDTMGPLSSDQQMSYNESFDKLQALNAGVNPDLLSGPTAGVVLRPFQQQRQMFELQRDRLQNDIAQSQARFGFDMQQRQQYMFGPLRQMGGAGEQWLQNPFIQGFLGLMGGGR